MRTPLVCLPAQQGVYRAYVANAKFVNATSLPRINFMAAAVVEMYGIEPCEPLPLPRLPPLLACLILGASSGVSPPSLPPLCAFPPSPRKPLCACPPHPNPHPPTRKHPHTHAQPLPTPPPLALFASWLGWFAWR